MSRSSLALLGLSALAAAAPTWIPAEHFDLTGRETFVSCLSSAGLNPVVQSDPAYAGDAAPFNLRLPHNPAALVYPHSAQDVSKALVCASKYKIPTNPRSGGHSYASYSIGGEDGHLIISLDNLRQITVDGDKAYLGAGNRLGDVALGIWEQGNRAMAHGTCPYVGIGGHGGHGGFGLPSRAWGVVLDQIYEHEVVLVNGSIVTANANTNSDLFWALRGASSSYGVITTFKAITHPAPAHNVWFTYGWSNLTEYQASQFMQIWQKFSINLSYLYGLQIHIDPQAGKTPHFTVDGYYYGDDGAANVKKTLQKLLDDYGIAPDSQDIEDQTWIEQVDFLAGVSTPAQLNTTIKPDGHDTFFADSIFISQNALMSQDASDALMHYLWTTATKANDHVAWFLIWDLWGGKQSFISNVTADATSFDARDALYSIQFYGSSSNGLPPYPSDGISIIEGMVSSITNAMPTTKFKGYSNYVSSQLTRDQAHQYYYPTHTTRLQQIKKAYDPNNIIQFPQSFLPA